MGDREYGVDPTTVDRDRRGDRRGARRPGRELAIVVGAREHLPRHGGRGRGDGPRDGRLRRHARDAPERAGAPGRARAARRADARAVGDRGLRGRRAVHPPPRDPPPREGARRDLRRRHRQPVLHDRHRRGAARARDRRRGDPDGEERRRRASTTATRASDPTRAFLPELTHLEAIERGLQGDGHDRALALHGQPRCRSTSSSSPRATSAASPRASGSARSSRPPEGGLHGCDRGLPRGRERRMDKSIEATHARVQHRSARAARRPALLDRITIDYYGTPTPLKQLATISAPEPRLLVVQPFDPARSRRSRRRSRSPTSA